eukprot:TRINITY_DN11700_c0_g1_i1.p1 TRINITY_DN11700_c0_g1~~TRINITY_DN11700_c0_g1_i1.p1  ORF type:complete len:144 (-),score=20.90 TRINITY_DN11700_c0_g1_i1:55-486(-)
MRRSGGYRDTPMSGSGFNRGLDAPTANRRQLWQQQSEELLESATNKQIDDLEATIGGLKQLGNEIHVEIGRSNSILDELRAGVDNTGGLLAAAQKKLKEVSESGSNRLMCYLVLFVILVFFIIYGVISWSTGTPSSSTAHQTT